MKYLFGFIAFIVIVVVINTIGDISLRFFHVPFHGVDVFLASGIVFLLLLVINMYNELHALKQTVMKLQSEVDSQEQKGEAE